MNIVSVLIFGLSLLPLSYQLKNLQKVYHESQERKVELMFNEWNR